jgi:hypothetical protein
MEDAMAAIPNAFEEALEGGELSSDAREMVEAWASAEAERSTQRRRMLEALLDEDLEAYEADQLGVAMP